MYMMGLYLQDDDTHATFGEKNCLNLLKDIKVYNNNFYQKALQKLTKDAGQTDLFFYLSMNFNLDTTYDYQVIDG